MKLFHSLLKPGAKNEQKKSFLVTEPKGYNLLSPFKQTICHFKHATLE